MSNLIINEVKEGSLIFEIKNVLTDKQCNLIKSIFDNNKGLQIKSSAGNKDYGEPNNKVIKSKSMLIGNCITLNVSNVKEIDNLLFNAVEKCIKLLIGLGFKPLIKSDEGYTIIKYNKGGFYSWHSDAAKSAMYYRNVTCVFYLNDVEEGGETTFKHQNISVKPEKGKVVMFSSSWTHEHCGEEIIKGDKYIVVTWLGENL